MTHLEDRMDFNDIQEPQESRYDQSALPEWAKEFGVDLRPGTDQMSAVPDKTEMVVQFVNKSFNKRREAEAEMKKVTDGRPTPATVYEKETTDHSCYQPVTPPAPDISQLSTNNRVFTSFASDSGQPSISVAANQRELTSLIRFPNAQNHQVQRAVDSNPEFSKQRRKAKGRRHRQNENKNRCQSESSMWPNWLLYTMCFLICLVSACMVVNSMPFQANFYVRQFCSDGSVVLTVQPGFMTKNHLSTESEGI